MNKLLALVVAVAFVIGSAGLALAQTAAPAPTEKKAEEKKAEKPMEKPAEKKMPARTANGTVKTATADSVVVAGKDKKQEVEWTFAVDAKTQIRKGGKSITAGDLKPGDLVHVRYMDVSGKAVAQAIRVKGNGMAKKEEGKK